MRTVSLTVLAATLAVAPEAQAQYDAWRGARVVHVEPDAWVQRASEPEADTAVVNLPFLPGDRLWTGDLGRVELQFDDAVVLRVSSGSKLDLGSVDDRGAVLHLWSGSIQLVSRNGRNPAYAVLIPGGRVEIDPLGETRVDVRDRDARVTVFSGEARLDAEGERVWIRAGERAYASAGLTPEPAQPVGAESPDNFASWNEQRDAETRWASDGDRYLPDELDPYAAELDDHGSWYFEASIGHVWRPRVSAGWQPYTYGRWVWTPYGWTWVADEPWGWTVSHYGRWGYSGGLGWYWIPGPVWGPAWVSWSVGPRYVGWCPLGYRNRPVIYPRHDRDRRYAVPRGSSEAAWVYAERGDLARHGSARPRPVRDVVVSNQAQLVDGVGSTLDRDLRVAHARPRPGTTLGPGDTKPGPGDTVPELRHDPLTTIPVPAPRRSVPRSREQSLGVGVDDRAERPTAAPSARPRLDAPRPSGSTRTERPVSARPATPAAAPRGAPLTRPPEPATSAPAARPRPGGIERFGGSGGDREAAPAPRSGGSYRPAPSGSGSRPQPSAPAARTRTAPPPAPTASASRPAPRPAPRAAPPAAGAAKARPRPDPDRDR